MASLRSGISSHTHLEHSSHTTTKALHGCVCVGMCNCRVSIHAVYVWCVYEQVLPDGLDNFMSSIVVFILEIQRERDTERQREGERDTERHRERGRERERDMERKGQKIQCHPVK